MRRANIPDPRRAVSSRADHRYLSAVLASLLVLTLHAPASAEPDAVADTTDDANAGASDASAAEEGPPELIKSYESAHLGQLKLPGLWEVADIDDGVRAVEPNQPRPAAIEIGALPLPEPVAAAELADNIAAELERALGGIRVVEREPIGDDDDDNEDGISLYYLELAGREHDTDMRYAVLTVTGRRRAIVASLGVPEERFEQFHARQLLQDILANIE